MKEDEVQPVDVDTNTGTVTSWIVACVLIVAAIVLVPMLVNMFL